MIDVTNFNKLRAYESTLSKYDFKKTCPSYMDPTIKKELASIYEDITGNNVCGSCSNDWIKRLSTWYFETMKSF